MTISKYAIARITGSPIKYFFQIEEANFKYAKQVVIETGSEKHLGFINSFLTDKEPKGKDFEKSSFVKYSDQTDKDLEAENEKWLITIKSTLLELVKKHDLTMNISHLRSDLERKKIIIYYTAPEHVDFRALLKELTQRYKSIIRLNQISSKQRFECFYHPNHIDYKSFKAIGYR